MRSLCLICLVVLTALFPFGHVFAQQPFLSAREWSALRDESNGAAPYENLRYLTTLHRVPATPQFEQAANFILQRAREYGLADAHSEQFPIDGTKTYGLMRSYLGWTVDEARLWEVRPEHLLLGDWATDPIRLADYSHSADVETELVDVGNGASEADYRGKDVRGKIVLADGVFARVQALAIAEHGAAGIVSDMPNQTTAWSGLDKTVVRWGHLDARQPAGFAFMVSRQTAELIAGTSSGWRCRHSECSREGNGRTWTLDGGDGYDSGLGGGGFESFFYELRLSKFCCSKFRRGRNHLQLPSRSRAPGRER